MPRDTSAHIRELRERGVAVLCGFFALGHLMELQDAADACFRAIESGQNQPVPEHYRYNQFSNSLLLRPVCDEAGLPFDTPIANPEVVPLLEAALKHRVQHHPDQCWLRKKYPPATAPPRHAPNGWHQDGALGVKFPPEPGPHISMTSLITCWIPLIACGQDRPALEFIRRPLNNVLHYSELEDTALRQRFPEQDFWTPSLNLGDGLIFLNGTLHRTHVTPAMREPRLSVEYRFFPV